MDEAGERAKYYTIYCKLHSVASSLNEDDQYTREMATKELLWLMDYVQDFIP